MNVNSSSYTPSQTIGPFFHDALIRSEFSRLDPEGVAGEPVTLSGRVLDGRGGAVTDAMIEVWQADGAGRYRHPIDPRSGEVARSFVGFGRVATGDDGVYVAHTVMPGRVAGRDGSVQAPHLNLQIFGRGLMRALATRVYFAGIPENEDDAVLSSVPAARRSTLVARRAVDHSASRYVFDIVLQGDDETVFFDI